MTKPRWWELYEEIGPDMYGLLEYGKVTGNFEPWGRTVDLLNAALEAWGAVPLDTADLPFYRPAHETPPVTIH